MLLSAIFESNGSAEEFCSARLLELLEDDDDIPQVAQAVGREIRLSDVEWIYMEFVHSVAEPSPFPSPATIPLPSTPYLYPEFGPHSPTPQPTSWPQTSKLRSDPRTSSAFEDNMDKFEFDF